MIIFEKTSRLKKIYLILYFFVSSTIAHAQSYWQQEVDNIISVSLNDKLKSLNGTISISYINNSPDTLSFIWFHLWPNAYKNDKTAFSDQELENGNTAFYFSENDERGYINKLNFKVNKISAEIKDHPQHQDIVKLILPELLLPGKSVNITTDFHVNLPKYFSRSGYDANSFYITQWYPKPAVYDKSGWHPMPYLNQGEFYSEFGNYKVSITTPQKFVIAATGDLVEETKHEDGTKTVLYQQNNIHDFAWFADENFITEQDTIVNPDGSVIKAFVYRYKESKNWTNAMANLKKAIHTKNKWVGQYPYNTVKVVQNKTGSGGMEYPTITLIHSSGKPDELDFLINHEVGHNWFYGILGSNEKDFPWMDEGMTSYYDNRYLQLKINNRKANEGMSKSTFVNKRMPEQISVSALAYLDKINRSQPVATPSETLSAANYNLVPYAKAAQWYELLEKKIGTEVFDKVMQTYYAQWKFRHPYPEDFRRVAETISGMDLTDVFERQNNAEPINQLPKKQIKFATFFNIKDSHKYHYLSLFPAIGVNKYDNIMIGAGLHNYNIPPSNFNFFIIPLYAVGSSQLNGVGRFSYTHYTGNNGNKIVLSVSGMKFTGDNYIDSTGKINQQPFSRIVPAIKYTFYNKNPRSSIRKSIELKNYFISETGLSFGTDTINHVTVINYPTQRSSIRELNFIYNNNRVLYPHSATLQLQHHKNFARINFTGNYYFNYSKGGGMNVRLFAGKFFYRGSNKNNYFLDRYKINMSGAKGEEDFTYGNYFFGRNEFEGFPTRQIMIKDGGFKVKTDLNYNKVGKTDDWLFALNFHSTIPKKVNPLSILPINIPLGVFADVGTYAGGWKKGAASGKFLYDAGLQLSIIKNTVNVYFPLLYSKVYKDYFKSVYGKKLLLNNIAFSIDIHCLQLRKFSPVINF